MSGPSVLFVCLGNICRSPLAEAAFRAETDRLGLQVEIDSAGTGDWHVGRPPDPRASRSLAETASTSPTCARGRSQEDDFRRFDHIIALDRRNLVSLRKLAPADARRSSRSSSIM
jgi:protein-tyrosine phosphatase